MDALAASGSVGRAWSGSTWTAPAMVSMFSGLPVRSHGWDFPFPRFMDEARESYPPLPDVPLRMAASSFVRTVSINIA